MRYWTLAILLTLNLTACTTVYQEAGALGGYEEKRINRTTYVLSYRAGVLANPFKGAADYESFWQQRATELCEGDDFEYQTESTRRSGPRGQYDPLGEQVVLGALFCNTKFLDTRQTASDTKFAHYKSISDQELAVEDISPLWTLLLDEQFEQLDHETGQLYQAWQQNRATTDEFNALMAIFSRVLPDQEEKFNLWVAAKPNSYVARYARALYFYSMALFEVSKHGQLDRLSKKQKQVAKPYLERAIADLNWLIEREAHFPAAYSQLIRIYNDFEYSRGQMRRVYKNGIALMPTETGIYLAYAETWVDGYDRRELKRYLEGLIAERAVVERLEAYYRYLGALELVEKKQYEKALEVFYEIKTVLNSPLLYVMMGLSQEAIELSLEAEKSYRDALTFYPFFIPAHENLARLYLQRSDFLKGLKATFRLVQLNNQNASYYRTQGDLFYEMRRYDDAVIAYKKATVVAKSKAYYKHKTKMAEFQLKVRKSDIDEKQELSI